MNNLVNLLKNNGIQPSFQRIKIFEFLNNNRTHPTVDNIYTHLSASIPTLSRTTVYNTLKLFVEKGIIRALNIEDGEQRFDYRTEEHGHFKCLSCGIVHDVEVQVNVLEDLEGCEISQKFMVIYGYCNKCCQKKVKGGKN